MPLKASQQHRALYIDIHTGYIQFNKDMKLYLAAHKLADSQVGSGYELPSGVDPATFLIGKSTRNVMVELEMLVMQGSKVYGPFFLT